MGNSEFYPNSTGEVRPASSFENSIRLTSSSPNSFSGRTKRLRESQQRINENSLIGLNLLQAFFPSSPEKNISEVFKTLSVRLGEGLTLKQAFGELPNHLQQEIQNRLGTSLQEVLALVQDPDGESFYQGALNLAQRLRQAKKIEASAGILRNLAAANVPEAIQKQAEAELGALTGVGSSGMRAEFLLENFVQQASDYRTVVPMIGASVVGQTIGTAILGRLARPGISGIFSRGWRARAFAGSAAFVPEMALFTLGTRTLNGPTEASYSDDYKRAALSLGALKVFGLAGNQVFLKMNRLNELGVTTQLSALQKFAQVAIPQSAMFFGMYGALRLEEAFNLKTRTEGETIFTHILGSMLSLQVGTHLGHRLLGPGFAAFQREMGIRANTYSKYGENNQSTSETLFPGVLGESLFGRPIEALASPGKLNIPINAKPSLAEVFAKPMLMSQADRATSVKAMSLSERAEALGMKAIPAGKFKMGSEDFENAQPDRKVHVSDFLMEPNLVTNERFNQYLKQYENTPDALFLTMRDGQSFIIGRSNSQEIRAKESEFRNRGIKLIAKIEGLYEEKDRGFLEAIEVFQDWQETNQALGTIGEVLKAEPTELTKRLAIHRVIPEQRKLQNRFKGKKKPAIEVDWYEAMGFAEAFSRRLRMDHPWMVQEGWTARLPREAEWEKAARGPEGFDYGTASGQLSQDQAHYGQNWNTGSTAQVGNYPANAYGLHDMAGNTWQWLSDWSQASYAGLPERNPKGPSSGKSKVLRGGSWVDDGPVYLRAACRGGDRPGRRLDAISVFVWLSLPRTFKVR